MNSNYASYIRHIICLIQAVNEAKHCTSMFIIADCFPCYYSLNNTVLSTGNCTHKVAMDNNLVQNLPKLIGIKLRVYL